MLEFSANPETLKPYILHFTGIREEDLCYANVDLDVNGEFGMMWLEVSLSKNY